jgi:hypothetical protein
VADSDRGLIVENYVSRLVEGNWRDSRMENMAIEMIGVGWVAGNNIDEGNC